MEKFNQALLGKQVWRIMQYPECLMARILRARYFSDGNILTAVQKKKASYAWKSILYGKELIVKGLRYMIGDGKTINTWTDPWISDHLPRPPRQREGMLRDGKLHQFFNEARDGWNEQKLREEMVDEDVDKILRIKISSSATIDMLGWHYTEHGLYTVKSGYWLSTHLPMEEGFQPTFGNTDLKRRIWKTRMPSKLHHFLWKTLSRSLATGSNLKRRHITTDDLCRRCCQEPETEKHLLFDCSYAQAVWRDSGIDNRILIDPLASLEEKIEACLQCSLHTRLAHLQNLPFWIMWRLWKNRNILIFQRKHIDWRWVLNQARRDAQEWKDNSSESMQRREQVHHGRNCWKRPRRGWLKCNVDSSFINSQTPCKAGWII